MGIVNPTMPIQLLQPACRRATAAHRRSRSFALLTTLLVIALLVAVSAELAVLSATGSVVMARRNLDLAHELALDSALLVLAEQLDPQFDSALRLTEALDRSGSAGVEFEVGEVGVIIRLRDDGAKFNPNLYARPDQKYKLERKLSGLIALCGLESITVRPRPVRSSGSSSPTALYVSFDQLVDGVSPGSILPLRVEDESWASRSLSEVVTLWGDGRVDIRRAEREVLAISLEDLRPNLADGLFAAQPWDRSIDYLSTALVSVDAEIRSQVESRLTFNLQRYALNIETAIQADRRRWYVVAVIRDGQLQVLHRSPVTW